MGEGNVYKWSFIDRISIALINFGVNIALARMLTADDFGLLAMIAIYTAIASDLSSCGLSDGLIHKTHPTDSDYSTVFVFNTVVGLVFGLIFFFTAPLTASFFGHEELTGIMRVVGICFFFQTMSYVQETRMRKQLRMRTMCLVRVGATITVSVLGIIAAAMGYGYKALVITQVTLSFFFFIYYTIASRWFPKIQFSVKSFKEFFNYGVHLMLAYLATLVGRNINTTVLGRFYSSPAMSGVYYQGAKLASVPFGVTESSLNYPFFAVASNEENAVRRRQLLKSMMSVIIAVNGFIMMYIFVIAAPGVELLYGNKWLASIPILRILAIAEFLMCVRAYMQTVCKVHARTLFVRNMGFIEVGVQLSLLAAFYRFGILWIAWTQVLGVAFATIIYLYNCRHYIGLSIKGIFGLFIRSLWLPGVSAAFGLAAMFIVISMHPLVQCAAVTLVFGLVFIAFGELFKVPVYIDLKNRFIRNK